MASPAAHPVSTRSINHENGLREITADSVWRKVLLRNLKQQLNQEYGILDVENVGQTYTNVLCLLGYLHLVNFVYKFE